MMELPAIVPPVKPLNKPEIWILDTEATGLAGKVIEVAGIQIDWQARKLQEFSQLFNPGIPIEPKAQEIHGIKDEDLIGMPDIKEWFGPQDTEILWIGHVAHFDVRMMDGVLSPSQVVDTMILARRHTKGTINHKLQTLKDAFGFTDQAAHRALGDCRTTHELLLYIMDLTGLSLEVIFDRFKEPQMINRMPFGQYQGYIMTSVPVRYRRWLLEQEDISRDMRYTLLKLNHL